jgi:hypothetical protein
MRLESREERVMKAVCLLACLGLATSVVSQEPVRRFDREQYTRDQQMLSDVIRRAHNNMPKRRDAPLREINLTDEEVREIQAATKNYLPADYLNISPVVTGCACEDGPECKEQVYVLADAGASAKGLQLSRIKRQWTVGALQQWWLNYGRLEERRKKMGWIEYERALITLAREFPMCAETVKPRAAPSTAQANPPPK